MIFESPRFESPRVSQLDKIRSNQENEENVEIGVKFFRFLDRGDWQLVADFVRDTNPVVLLFFHSKVHAGSFSNLLTRKNLSTNANF